MGKEKTVPVTARFSGKVVDWIEGAGKELGWKRAKVVENLVWQGILLMQSEKGAMEKMVRDADREEEDMSGLTGKLFFRNAREDDGDAGEGHPPRKVGAGREARRGKVAADVKVRCGAHGGDRKGADVSGVSEGKPKEASEGEQRFRECRHGNNSYTCETVACKIETGRA